MKESFQEKKVEREEVKDIIENARFRLSEMLELEARSLREEGYPVDDKLRIVPKDISNADRTYVTRKEEWIEAGAREDEHERENQIRGEILEMAKCALFNQKLFNNKLVAVRTAKYDDFANGVDQLIFDTETLEPMAAVDTTTSWQIKSREQEALKHIKEGAAVRYGLALGPKKVERKSYQDLPYFIISISPEELAEIIQSFTSGFSEEQRETLERSFLERLKKQAQLAQKISMPAVAESNRRAEKIFDRLLSEKNG